jgi:hypothetical protein
MGGGGCGREDCMLCTTGDKKHRGKCNLNSILYQQTCLTCKNNGVKAIYIGESGRNAYTRGGDHLTALEKMDAANNALAKHCVIHHGGMKQPFKMDLLGIYKGCLQRQVAEGVEIRKSDADIIMNSKSQWEQPPIVRVIAVEGNLNVEEIDNRGNTRRGSIRNRVNRGY